MIAMSQVLDQNLKEALNVYIGRKGVVFVDGDSIWANPYKVGKNGTIKQVLELYKTHIKAQFR